MLPCTVAAVSMQCICSLIFRYIVILCDFCDFSLETMARNVLSSWSSIQIEDTLGSIFFLNVLGHRVNLGISERHVDIDRDGLGRWGTFWEGAAQYIYCFTIAASFNVPPPKNGPSVSLETKTNKPTFSHKDFEKEKSKIYIPIGSHRNPNGSYSLGHMMFFFLGLPKALQIEDINSESSIWLLFDWWPHESGT